MKSDAPQQPKTLGERFNDYAAATVQELDLLTQAGFSGISAVGSEDGTTAIIVFSGQPARDVFLRVLRDMEASEEYKKFTAGLQQPNGS